MLRCLLLLSSFLCVAFAKADAQNWSSKLDESLLLEIQQEETIHYYVQLTGTLDWSGWRSGWSKEQKGQFVYEKLQERSATVTNFLNALMVRDLDFQYYYLTNGIEVTSSVAELERIAASESAKQLIALSSFKADNFFDHSDELTSRFDPEDVEWGVRSVGALPFWEAGIRGAGVVVGGQDTGVDWNHPALRPSYRGVTSTGVDHNYNWHDAIYNINPLHQDSIVQASNNRCGLQVEQPCDDSTHGTQTMGLMVGEEGDNLIGVAPEAQWIACRNMERGYGTPTTYIECFEWFLAPTDLNNENPDPTRSPHVIANSWSCPELEGCNPAIFPIMEEAVSNLKRAGIFVVVSAGNSGRDGCGTVSTPAAIYEASFTVGAYAKDDTLADFSSRGPVIVDGSYRLKPNVVGPGVRNRSSRPGDRYTTSSGTSLSGPYVAGVVALVISARPDLSGQVEAIETLLEETARPIFAKSSCQDSPLSMIPNSTFGFGAVDGAAVLEALDLVPVVKGVDSGRSFPNPVLETTTIEWAPIASQSVNIRVFDVLGRYLTTVEAPANPQAKYRFDSSQLAAGTYFLELQSRDYSTTLTIIKIDSEG